MTDRDVFKLEGLIMYDEEELGAAIVQMAAEGNRAAQQFVSYTIWTKAEQGDPKAQALLVVSLVNEAKNGNTAAQTVLGKTLIDIGHPDDGIKWLQLAARSGDSVARQWLNELQPSSGTSSRKSSGASSQSSDDSDGCGTIFFIGFVIFVLWLVFKK